MSKPPTIRKHKAEKVFEYELGLIQDEEIRNFVIVVFKRFTPDYFWTVPCSTSGKYHPQISLGEGGLVRHVKLAVWWGIELMRTLPHFDDQPEKKDVVVAALLLHDLKKNGEALDPRGYPTLENATAVHGVYLADQVLRDLCSSYGPEGEPIPEKFELVVDGIRYHMGRWTEGFIPEHLDVVTNQVVHLADYCASRKVDDTMERLLNAS